MVTVSYGNQFQFMILTLFARLYRVFKNTEYKLNKTTIIIYIVLFIAQPISVAMLLYLTFDNVIFYTSIASVLIFGTLVNISIVGIFVFKLLKVAQDHEKREKNTVLSDVAAKNTLLALISSIATIFAAICFVLYYVVFKLQNVNNDANEWIPHLFESIDCFTNFICIALSYDRFDDIYQKICGRTHTKFRMLANRITMSQEILAISMNSVEQSSSGVSSEQDQTEIV